MRYTLYYQAQGREHTLQFPARDAKAAKLLAKDFWQHQKDALKRINITPEFQKFVTPAGRVLKWTP